MISSLGMPTGQSNITTWFSMVEYSLMTGELDNKQTNRVSEVTQYTHDRKVLL
jgi:hypothetical protein